MRLGDESLDVPCITGKGVEDPEAMREDTKTVMAWCEEYMDKEENVPFRVRIAWNPHDFGEYPSLEIYYDVSPCDGDDTIEGHEDGTDCEHCKESDEMHGAIDKFSKAYSAHFGQWM